MERTDPGGRDRSRRGRGVYTGSVEGLVRVDVPDSRDPPLIQ